MHSDSPQGAASMASATNRKGLNLVLGLASHVAGEPFPSGIFGGAAFGNKIRLERNSLRMVVEAPSQHFATALTPND